MLLEDKNEIATTLLNQITNFVQKTEANNYCDPDQFADAQRAFKILINLLDYKMKYLEHVY